ncbi:hypothetical protein OPT61_g2396 [Boeremia exigua]|uniref:Uncharacterized protein n=1 Tax=Boeremia exigua TaxID=749465 RepID=A0ACC2ILP4_9PLEO|nr:hypothetical protein OPT61_g2396 [Boeremia exigua]
MPDGMSDQNGFEWIEGTFGLEPSWSKEPDANIISQVTRKQLNLSHDTPIEVVFQYKGAFTKLYKITSPVSACSMRISLPVDPIYRTESAVAVVGFIRQQTSISSPHVIAYSAESSNELGFEWLLMGHAPGIPLYKVWRKLSWDAKVAVVEQLAEHQAQLFKHEFHKIGNLYLREDGFVVDRLISSSHYQGDHVTNRVIRGPFTSSHEWLKTRLQRVLAEQQRIIDTSCDEDEIEDAEFAHNLAQQLCELLATVFLPSASATEATVLFHHSLSMYNISIDGDGNLSEVMDWECVSAVPVWRACRLPELFEERVREAKPLKENYSPDSDEDDDKDDDGLDNEGITDLYWEHLLEYELTQLREIFLREMDKKSPGWSVLAKQAILKNDFERAVEECDNGWRNKSVRRWVDSLAAGEPRSLIDMFLSDPEIDQVSQTSMDWEKAE